MGRTFVIKFQIGHTTRPCHHFGKNIPANAVVATLSNGDVYVCTRFPQNYKGSHPYLKISIYNRLYERWEDGLSVRDTVTEKMYRHYLEGGQKKMKHETTVADYADLMKHDRKHKKAGGGQRDCAWAITDYECSKNPLHDFARTMY